VNIGDMHIGVQHGVDKINSMHSDLLLPEEIDLELNKNILRFVHTRFNPRGNRYQKGFEMSQKRIDDLRTLIVEASVSTAYKGHVFNNTWIDAGFLPADYLNLINLKCLVKQDNCKKMCTTEIVAQQQPITFKLDTDLANHTAIPSGTDYSGAYIGYEPAGGAPYYAGLTTLLTGAYSPVATQTQAAFKSWLLNSSNWKPGVIITSGTGAFVDVTIAVGYQYSMESLGIVFFDPSNIPLLDYSKTDNADGATTPSNVGPFGNNLYWAEKRVPCADQEYTQMVGVNEFSQHDDIYTILQDPFNKTTYKSPLFTMKENYIEIYTDDTFIVDALKLTYLKRPAEVDGSTNNIDCDLPAHTHQEIVDMTVATILEGISDPRYQSSNMEVLKSE
jgi:hypothetical protein